MMLHLVKTLEKIAAATGLALFPLLNYRNRIRWSRLVNIAFSAANRRNFRGFGPGARIASSATFVNPHCITLGANATVGAHSVISAWTAYHDQTFMPTIEIGNETSIGANCHLTAINRISIGSGVLFGMNVTVSDNAHGPSEAEQLHITPMQRPLVSKGPVEIGDNVWIGSKATILSGVRIGAGAIIAANAVVLKDVPDATVVAGIPARPIKDMTQ